MRICFTLLLFVAGFSLSHGQTYDIQDGDTINYKDVNGKKQGYWIINGTMKKQPGYGPEAIIEEGEYKDNRKQGLWKKYYPNGKIQNEITYRNNRPTGPYTVYYPNGQIEEQGEWKNNRNTGTFKRFYENGQPQQHFNFNESGKREGEQTYYHDNGQIMIQGTWAGGKEAGELREYHSDGSLKAVKFFNDGTIDPAKTETFEPKTNVPVVEVIPEEKTSIVSEKVDTKSERPNIGPFTGTGDHTLFNQNKQISQKGYFKNYRLINGEVYRYDENGILQGIEIYKNGKYVGEGVPPKD